MARPDMEKRRRERRRPREPADEPATTSDDGTPTGVFVVAVAVALGGAVDLVVGLGLFGTSLVVFAPIVAALGAIKLWAGLGLARLRVRALGVAILLHVVSAMLGGLRLAFVTGGGTPESGIAIRVVVDLVIVGYLLVVADAFD